MRRSYEVSGGGPTPTPIPFAENCVFYAPLDEGDLTDHISGVSPTTDSGCSIVWDETKGMYKFSAVTTWNAAARYANLNMGLYDGQAITLVIDVAEVSFSGNRYMSMFCIPKYTQTQTQTYQIRHYSYNTGYSPLTSLTRYALTHDGTGKIRWYKNGVYVTYAQWGADRLLSQNTVDICQLPGNNYSYSMYAKNAIVYNRCLTDAEIASLQNAY